MKNPSLGRALRAALILAFAGTMPLPAADRPAGGLSAGAGFALLKGLVGDWQGRVMDRETGPETRVTWRLTAGGSALVETLFPGTAHEMVTVYHQDRDRLVLTHYCAMGNQPRMVLDAGSGTNGLVFAFEGGTNLDPARDTHMHSGRLRPEGTNILTAEWHVYQGGRAVATNWFFLRRAS